MLTADVEVYVARVIDTPSLRGLLDEDDERRLEALHRPADRARLVASHALLRLALAARSGLDAAEIVLERRCPTCGSTEHGRLEAPDLDAYVSLGHAGDLVVVALADAGQVGVDVEVESACGFEGFDEVSLHPEEIDELDHVAPADRDWARATWWVRKEAALKATGHGLTLEPSTLWITPPADEPAVVQWPGDDDLTIHLADVRVPSGHTAAVALLDPTDRIAAIEVVERDGDELLDLDQSAGPVNAAAAAAGRSRRATP